MAYVLNPAPTFDKKRWGEIKEEVRTSGQPTSDLIDYLSNYAVAVTTNEVKNAKFVTTYLPDYLNLSIFDLDGTLLPLCNRLLSDRKVTTASQAVLWAQELFIYISILRDVISGKDDEAEIEFPSRLQEKVDAMRYKIVQLMIQTLNHHFELLDELHEQYERSVA